VRRFDIDKLDACIRYFEQYRRLFYLLFFVPSYALWRIKDHCRVSQPDRLADLIDDKKVCVLPIGYHDDAIVIKAAIEFRGLALSCDTFSKEQYYIAKYNKKFGRRWDRFTDRRTFRFVDGNFECDMFRSAPRL